MSSYARWLVVAFVVGPLAILGLFAWSAGTGSAAPSEEDGAAALASSAVTPDGESASAPAAAEPATSSDDADEEAVDGGRIKALPQAQGLPEPRPEFPAPIGIRIPDVDVDGQVVPVGVEGDGAFEVPAVHRVGWYRFGSNAGQPGSTVLAAHISYDGVDGVFRHLESVSPGADVAVVLADESEVRYRIVEVVEYEKADLPVEDLFAETGDDRLVLITCGGTFNPRLRTYESNVVAYAEPIAG